MMRNLDAQGVLPLTTHDMLSLVRYADAMERSAARRHGIATTAHSQDVRRLASRMVDFDRGEIGAFTAHDVALLTQSGDDLVQKALTRLANPAITRQARTHAQARLVLGRDLLEVRDRVEQFVP